MYRSETTKRSAVAPQVAHILVVSSYKESCNNKPMYGYMLPNLSPSPNLYKVQSVYNNNVAS